MKLTTNKLSSAALTLMMLLAPAMAAETATNKTTAATPVATMQQARLIKQVNPVYPLTAKQARIQGAVKFTAIINVDGSLTNIQPVSGHPALVPAAMEAVKQWIYTPTMLDGAPVALATGIEVTFALRQ